MEKIRKSGRAPVRVLTEAKKKLITAEEAVGIVFAIEKGTETNLADAVTAPLSID